MIFIYKSSFTEKIKTYVEYFQRSRPQFCFQPSNCSNIFHRLHFRLFGWGILGLNPRFSAAIGLVALFCGVANAPVASIILSIELFRIDGLLLFAIACSVSYMLSDYYGLYSSQKIVYSKLKAEFININANFYNIYL